MHPDCPSDCVTMVRIVDTALTVRGYCNSDTLETVKDKLLKVIQWDLDQDVHPARVRSSLADSG